jgi:hypothetical protein
MDNENIIIKWKNLDFKKIKKPKKIKIKKKMNIKEKYI